MPAVRYQQLSQESQVEPSSVIGKRILAARSRQYRRLEPFGIFCNAQMTPRTLRRFCKLDGESEHLMENAITRLGLSARAYDRILPVSRTIAERPVDWVYQDRLAEAGQTLRPARPVQR